MEDDSSYLTIPLIRRTPSRYLRTVVTIKAYLLVQKIIEPKVPKRRRDETELEWLERIGHIPATEYFRSYIVDIPWQDSSETLIRECDKYFWKPIAKWQPLHVRVLWAMRRLPLFRQWLIGCFTKDAIFVADQRIISACQSAMIVEYLLYKYFYHHLPVIISGRLRRSRIPEFEFEMFNIEWMQIVRYDDDPLVPATVTVDFASLPD